MRWSAAPPTRVPSCAHWSSGERFDKARAQALVDEKTHAIRAGSPGTIDALADFYDSLKPEQQAKLREFMDKRGRGGWRS